MNLKPLIALFEQQADIQPNASLMLPSVELVTRPPSQLYPLLKRGEVDASFIASVDYLRHQNELYLVPRFGVAARGSVASVLLLCRKQLGKVEEILVDERSSTSVAMLQILLRHKFHLEISLAPGNVTGNPQGEAVLVIGDRALQSFEDYEFVYDIGAEWTSWTDLPFVFGVWVAREEEHVETVTQLLEAGWQWGREHWDEIIQTESRRTGLSPSLIKVYLQERIQYELTSKEYEGLNRFGELLETIEILPEESEIEML